MANHFRNICPHSFVLGQCRCPSPTKMDHVVPCPVEGSYFYDKHESQFVAEGQEGGGDDA